MTIAYCDLPESSYCPNEKSDEKVIDCKDCRWRIVVEV